MGEDKPGGYETLPPSNPSVRRVLNSQRQTSNVRDPNVAAGGGSSASNSWRKPQDNPSQYYRRLDLGAPSSGSRSGVEQEQGRSGMSYQPQEAARMGMPDFGSKMNGQSAQGAAKFGWGGDVPEMQPSEDSTREQPLEGEAGPGVQEPSHRTFEPGPAPQTSDTISDIFSNLRLDARTKDQRMRSGSNGYMKRGPSMNQDSFWSSSPGNDPPPRPRQSPSGFGSGDFGGTGYRATPFNPADEYDSSMLNSDSVGAEEAGSWSHLRPRGSNNTSPPSGPQKPPVYRAIQDQRWNYRQSQDDIDRDFRNYQARRNQQAPRMDTSYAPSRGENASPHNPFTRNGNDATARANRRCARCLEVGHSARDCTAPPEKVRVKCNICGQVGHMRNECPARYEKRGVRSVFAEPKVDQVFGRTVSSSEDYNPFNPGVESRETAKREQTLWQPYESAKREVNQREERKEDDALVERRARRSKRGFEDEVGETAEPTSDLRERRTSRRSLERDDDEARDEANALREERVARKSARKAARRKAAEGLEHQGTPLMLPEFISVSQLAQALNVRYERLLGRLSQEGYDDIFPGKILNMETSGMIAMEYNFEPQFEFESAVAREEQERDLKPRPEPDDKSLLPTRPPVVTIMGHVDHGKTTILDFLRKSSVAAGEAGGITQHIGAFSVPLSSSGRTITFLDTPGHAAFLAMRQRGANVTDIVVLVVAADDSVKPQTLESLRCAREAGVPILVAINKVDKEGADVQRVKQDLAKHGVEIEDFGGDVQTVELSGKTGQGMADFEEAIVTLSEILDHRAETTGDVEGWVLEATTRIHGRVATILVKRGTLRLGQIIVAGKTWARVRTLKNEKGQALAEASPGMPVEVDGWKDQALAGDQVLQAPNEQRAGAVVDYRIEVADREKANEDMEAINEGRRLEQEKREKEKAAEKAEKRGMSPPLEDTVAATQDQQVQNATSGQITVPFIIKADVSGSAEAVEAYIPSLTSPLIAPRILISGVGAVNESDIEYAAATQGHIIAFNLSQNNEALGMAESKGVKILENDVIYRTLDQVKELLEDKLPPLITQRVLGEAEVAAGFEIGLGGRKTMKIAGCKVRNGVVGMKSKVRVIRGGVGGEKVYDGEFPCFVPTSAFRLLLTALVGLITSLKNVKKDVQEMRKGTECGMGFEGWEGFEVGDIIQTYEEISEKRRL